FGLPGCLLLIACEGLCFGARSTSTPLREERMASARLDEQVRGVRTVLRSYLKGMSRGSQRRVWSMVPRAAGRLQQHALWEGGRTLRSVSQASRAVRWEIGADARSPDRIEGATDYDYEPNALYHDLDLAKTWRAVSERTPGRFELSSSPEHGTTLVTAR